MVYMAASDSPELDFVATRDLKEMERGIGAQSDVRVVVQINRHWPPTAQRYQVQANGSRLLKEQPQGDPDTDMGDEKTLTEFVTSVASNDEFAARNYGLILWGHAYGLGFGRDHNDALTLPEIKTAVAEFIEKRQKHDGRNMDTGGTLELLGTNACAMSYIEAAYEMREVAQFMVASQITMPFAGWPYEAILSRITSATKPADLAKLIVGAYVRQFDDLPNGDKLAMTALNLERAKNLNTLVSQLAAAITKSIQPFDPDVLAYFRDVFTGAAAGDVRPLIDVVRLCDALSRADREVSPRVGDAVRTALQKVRDAAEALAAAMGSADDPALIAYYERHPELDDLNGVGIYAPFVTDDGILIRLGLKEPDQVEKKAKEPTGQEVYESLELFKSDRVQPPAWPALVYKGLQRTIPCDLLFTIDGISEMRNGDRADVAQIIMAIDSSLNQLDRVVRTASEHMSKASVASSPAQMTRRTGAVAATSAESAKKAFNRLNLLAPVPRRPEEPKKVGGRQQAAVPKVTATPGVLIPVVDQLARVERALAEVERTTRRGLTNTRFGLGPLSPAAPGFGPNEPPRGFEPPKSGGGLEPPKSGGGLEPPKSGGGLPLLNATGGGDLRVDLAFTRVVELFQQVGQEMIRLEQAVGDVEDTVRAQLAPTDPPVDGQSGSIERAFRLLQEASSAARRTVRRVLAHPVYGLGPAETELTDDARHDLARHGGLDKLHLRLL